jgi:hypothetical protein
MSDQAAEIEGIEGHVALATDRGRHGESVSGPLRLRRWEGVVVDSG